MRGLVGSNYVASKAAAGIADDGSWYDYYKAKISPDYKEGIQLSKFEQTGGFALGAGISLATAPDTGLAFSSKLFFLASLPDVLLLQGQAAILAQRVGLDVTEDPLFSALIAISGEFDRGRVRHRLPDSGRRRDPRHRGQRGARLLLQGRVGLVRQSRTRYARGEAHPGDASLAVQGLRLPHALRGRHRHGRGRELGFLEEVRPRRGLPGCLSRHRRRDQLQADPGRRVHLARRLRLCRPLQVQARLHRVGDPCRRGSPPVHRDRLVHPGRRHPEAVQGPRDRRRPELDLRERAQHRRDRVPRHQRRGEPRAGAGAELRHRGVVRGQVSRFRGERARPRRLGRLRYPDRQLRRHRVQQVRQAGRQRRDHGPLRRRRGVAVLYRADPAAEGQVDAGQARVPRAQRVHQVLGRHVEGLRHLHGDDAARGSRRRLRRGPRGLLLRLLATRRRHRPLQQAAPALTHAALLRHVGLGAAHDREFRDHRRRPHLPGGRDRGDLRRLGGGAASHQIPVRDDLVP